MSDAIYDAWKVKPPCEGEQPYCSSGCPYFEECGSQYDDIDEDED